MGQFLWPDWKPLPQDSPLPPPSPDPEQAIADNTRAEEALNQFIAARQNALFEAPDAFYRTQGSDAIHAAPVILDRLSRLRDDSLDSLANDAQRDRLGSALDAHLQLARDDIARHVAEQSLAWQRKTAQDRIGLLTKEAAYHHNDDELVDALGHAAANAARAHARVGDAPLDPQAEDAAAAFARSGVLGAAIKARLDRGDAQGANGLLTLVNDQLDPAHAIPLQGQFEMGSNNGIVPANDVPDAATGGPPSDAQVAKAPPPAVNKRLPKIPSASSRMISAQRAKQWDAILTAQPPAAAPGNKVQETVPDDWERTVNARMSNFYPPTEPSYADLTKDAAKRYGIPPLLLARLLYRESNYDRTAGFKIAPESAIPLWSGKAVGIGQMFEPAAEDVGSTQMKLAQGTAKNQIDAAAAYLTKQYKSFNDWPKAVAAYHSGPTAIMAWHNGTGPDYEALEGQVAAAKIARGNKAPTKAELMGEDKVNRWKELKTELSYVFLGDPRRYDPVQSNHR